MSPLRSAQVQPTGGGDDDAAPTGPLTGAGAGQTQVGGVDDILDEIDSVLETNAAAFVQGFVQKGGQ